MLIHFTHSLSFVGLLFWKATYTISQIERSHQDNIVCYFGVLAEKIPMLLL